MDANAQAAALMKNPQFLEMFQKAMGDGQVPDEKDPKREEWLKGLQAKLAEESTKEARKNIEQPVSDAEGQWMWIVPEPGFCIKCHTTTGDKVFLNICTHPKIAEPIPLEEEEDDDTIKFKIPLSCGSLRMDQDKAGKPAKVYDIVVNPNTVKRCSEDGEFRRFLAALSMQWVKQKSEQHLNADEFKNINIKCKGKPDLQRIRLNAAPKAANAMQDEIRLPGGGTEPQAQAGGKKLVQEITPEDSNQSKKSAAAAASSSSASVVDNKEKETKPSIEYKGEGQYDWSKHKKAARNPHFREQVPEYFNVEAIIPVQTIKEVDVQIFGRDLRFVYVDSEDGKPFLELRLPFPVNEDPESAKFVRKKKLLTLKLVVDIPDEVEEEKKRTNVSRCAMDEEEEERQKKEAADKKALEEQRAKYDRIQKEAEDVMQQRKDLVENLNAVSAGDIPPSLKKELDEMPKEQLHSMMVRIDGRIKKGDSVDQLLERLPPDALDGIVNYIRGKLGLEVKKPEEKKVQFKNPEVAAASEKGMLSDVEDDKSSATVEFNFAKKAEQLTGVLMNNRYLFALDH